MKKYISLLMALIFLVGGGACVTSTLYQKHGTYTSVNQKNPTNTYAPVEEEVSTFLITQDKRQLIVAGKNRHYIFEPNATLKYILTWPQRNLVKASFDRFVIDEQKMISGEYTLTVEVNNQLSKEAKSQLLNNGFVFNTSATSLDYKGELKGKCYSSGGMVIPKTYRFNKSYKVTIQEIQIHGSTNIEIKNIKSGAESDYTPSTTERILLTPLALTADGLLFAVGVPVMIFALPFMNR